jgi:hypothetical protein
VVFGLLTFHGAEEMIATVVKHTLNLKGGNMRTRVLIALLVIVAFVGVGATAGAAKSVKVRGGFAWHPLESPVPAATVKANWQKLTKDAPGWKLYTVKSMSYAGGGNAMNVLLQDDTGLDVQTTLTQPQWLGFTSACVETTGGVMVGAHQVSDEIVAFAAPVAVK